MVETTMTATMPRPGSRLLVVGAGARATTALLPALHRAGLPLTVAAVCDPNPAVQSRLADLARDGVIPKHVPIFANIDATLAAGAYDIAMLACPHSDHFRYAMKLIEAGVTVWKEKPYALCLDDAALLAAQTNPGIRVLAHRPHGQLLSLAAQRLQGWGRLVSYRIRITRQTSDYAQTWRADASRAGGGAICDLGYHAFDLIARLAEHPTTVYAVTSPSPAHRPRVAVEESAHLTITHAGGCAGTVYLSRCDDRADEITLVAEGGSAVISGDQATFSVPGPGGHSDRVELTADDDPQAAMLRHHFHTLGDPAVTVAEARIGVRATALIEAAYASLNLGGPAPVVTTGGLTPAPLEGVA